MILEQDRGIQLKTVQKKYIWTLKNALTARFTKQKHLQTIGCKKGLFSPF